jgi:hypothetical protein
MGNMKRAALLCLILTACQDDRPPNGLQYTGVLSLPDVQRGDTVPFELRSGTYKLFATSEAGCGVQVSVKRWGGQEVVADLNAQGIVSYVLQVPRDGWFYASGRAGPGVCPTTLDVYPQ